MKILRLETRNLASLEGDNVIDFEQGILGTTQMFCIVGPTGSGKSTILDAICLPLYGKAPRYPLQKGQRGRKIDVIGTPAEDEKNRLAPTDPRNILTNGQKDGFSKLTFRANDGHTYRAEWTVRKKRLNYDKAEKSLVCIERDAQGQVVERACPWEDLERQIIGLGFEQFLRTVLIAQGSFASFLNASDEERMTLLERLVGNEGVYVDFAAEVKKQRTEANEAYQALSTRAKVYESSLLGDEALAQTRQQLAELITREGALRAQLKLLETQEQWYKAAQELTQAAEKQRSALLQAQAGWDRAECDREVLTLHDETVGGVALFRDKDTQEVALQRAQKRLDESQRKIGGVTKRLDAHQAKGKLLEEEAERAKQQLAVMQPHIEKAKQLVTLLATSQTTEKDKATSLQVAQKRRDKALKALRDNGRLILADEQQLETLTKALQEAQERNVVKQHSLEESLAKAKEALDLADAQLQQHDASGLRTTKEQATSARHDAKEAGTIVERIEAAKGVLVTNKAETARLAEENKRQKELLQGLDIDGLTSEIDTLQRAYTLMNSENWSEHRSHLEDNKPCPLCGAVHHPYADSGTVRQVMDDSHKLLVQKKELLKGLNTQKSEAEKALSRNLQRLENIALEDAKQSKVLAEARQEWEVLAEKHTAWKPEREWLAALLPDLESAELAADKALLEHDSLMKRVNLLRQDKEKAEQARNVFSQKTKAEEFDKQKELTALRTHTDGLRGQTVSLRTELGTAEDAVQVAEAQWTAAQGAVSDFQRQLREELGDQDPTALEQLLKTTCDLTTQQLKTHQAQQATLAEQLGTLQGAKSTLTASIEETEAKLAKAQTALTAWLKEYNDKHEMTIGEEDLESFALAGVDWEKQRKEINDLRNALTAAKTALQIAEEALREHQATKPEADLEHILAQHKQFTTAINEAREATIPLQTLLANHDDAVKAMGALAANLREADRLRTDWSEVGDAIGGDGKTLRKMVQCYTLNFLVHHANAELRRFNHRYELRQVKHSLGLRVVDHDRADEVRDTTSLSGGETFIVSLGLALGLSSLSSRNVRFDNFFIDEGFGTLDPDALATVIDALSTLQSAQGKKVGVISHTDTMSERITTQIRVVKEGTTGKSHIEISDS